MQMQTRYHLTSVRMAIIKVYTITNIGEDVEKREPLYTVGENVNWCSHCGKQYGGSLKKWEIELPYDPASPLLGIYPKKKKNSTLKRHMHSNVHSSIIYNRQDT